MTDTQALEQSTCTSSLVKNDKSNYWTPSLYFKDPTTGMLESVEMFYMNVYYFFEPTTDKIQAFEPGMRMVIGDPTLRSPPSSKGNLNLDLGNGQPAQPIQWTCPRSNTNVPLYPADSDGLHGVGIGDSNNKGAGTGFPDQNCDGYASPLRADIHFPSCYNPKAGLRDYKTNAVFPTNSKCPEGWIHTPHMFYEVYWNTPKFASRWTPGQGNQPFVLANGDPTGYGLHADFISGWDKETLQQIIDNCDAGDAGMDKCPGLIGGLNDPSTTCNIVSPIEETIFGTMAALPGNNPISEWGAKVAGGVASAAGGAVSSSAAALPTVAIKIPVGATTTAVAAVQTTFVSSVSTPVAASPAESTATGTPSTSASVASGWTYKGCFGDGEHTSRVLTGITFANVGKVSNTNCVAYCAKAGFSMGVNILTLFIKGTSQYITFSLYCSLYNFPSHEGS
ncbi:hypothetical protein M7I_7210 [Glarea lozoyensis 74030]|uniref:DUF1996 domain-containing protein n=1 Tax=Glarea lozoyensis (strain ATCC 74030 / MF5533) TaxID=1104152 RepID=H0EWN8_GLAL7|nr:hypothetical protein M7I_7210 [Glarea lozoyensis 74030]